MHSKHRFCSNDHGFSLVELIVVIAIMAILAAVAIPTFAHFITMAKEASDIAFMNDLEHAIMLAATADMKTGEISELQVVINKNDGSIIKITYFDKHHLDYGEAPNEATERIEYYSFEKGDGQTISQIIDWDYKFKAHNSVKDNKHWKDDRWTLTLITTSDNQESPQDPPHSEDQNPSGNQNSSGDQPPWAFDENLE
jgi:prepilin-type N-terminal cleavage/methylation domain-containing protein